MRDVIEKPKIDELVGTWKIDSFSYKFLKTFYEIGDREVLLNINEDGSLYINNMPDLNTLEEGTIDRTNFYNLEGKWNLFQFKEGGKWYLHLRNFSKSLGLTTSLHLYHKDANLAIVSYIGDPDEGNRLLFFREE
ncbi:hypothetical protein MHTCC0001_19710 [Flavobacteriaceae bacterium MHTCC 0001]